MSSATGIPFQSDVSALQSLVPAEAMANIQREFAREWLELSASAQAGKLPPLKDRRFAAPAWRDNAAASLSAHTYLLSCRTLQQMVEAIEGDEALRERIRFVAMQWMAAVSPANFFALNPDAQRLMVETAGESLRKGFANLLGDMAKGRMTQTDESQFEVGRNLASTPGTVVFENHLMQVIQYTPTTPTVFSRPLVMVPPCINKYYILDLQAHNSVVAYLVAAGFTVFMVSWRNPLRGDTDGIERATWDDYLEHGVLKGLEVGSAITGQKQVNALGFCVGGTMLASALAAARTNGHEPVASITLLTSLLDFAEPGMLSVFVDENHARLRELQMGKGGLMPASELASTFSFLRPDELVWNYVVSNYLKGETPAAFDLLYWNSDSTNQPGPFFSWYFRNAYLENALRVPGKTMACGVPLDLSVVDVPAYLYASREDHIVPWQSAFESTAILKGENRFVLGASGHIAGVINPPSSGKRNYWVNEDATFPVEAETWLDGAKKVPGSWWPDWRQWLESHSGEQVKAPARAGNKAFHAIEPAPGRYVMVRAT